jgi:hypothetical protein
MLDLSVGLLYPIITVLSIICGIVLSYFFDLTRLFGIYKAHDLGLGNLFLSIAIFTLVGQMLSLVFFFHSKLIYVILCVIIIDSIIIIKLCW